MHWTYIAQCIGTETNVPDQYSLRAGATEGYGWRTSGNEIARLQQWKVRELRNRLEEGRDVLIVDVRQPGEWASGHIEDAIHITGAMLPDRFHEIPRDRTVAIVCGSGYRSSVAASYLQHNGYENITNVLGGMAAWNAAAFPVV